MAEPSPSPAHEDAANPTLAQSVQGHSSSVKQPPDDDEEFPSTRVALTVMTANLLAMFLVSLDRTIIATAIPYITDEFDSIDDISWYGSAYLLANASLQLFYGRIYKFYPVKNIFLASICLFEVGSAVCGAAPNSIALIIGRAIAGAGSAGVMSGIMQILVYLVPLSKRPIYTGFFGAIFGVSSVIGPVLGGAFTQRLSWRWCFYINLPFAAVSIPAVVFLVKARAPLEAGFSFKEKVNRLDPIGSVIFVPCVVCLILALQWGGVVYPWGSARIIALLVVFGLLLLTWLAVQTWRKENATVPPRIFLRRSTAAAFTYATLVSGSLLVLVYYMPIWFQAIKGDSPIKSGISTLSSVLGMVVSSIITGIFTQKIGYYVPTMITGPVIASIGAGLLTTLKLTTGYPQWIGYQFLYGFGIGMGIQQGMLAAQTVLPGADVSIGIALMFFGQQLGGSIWLAVAQNIFLRQLTKGLTGIGSLSSEEIVNTGVTELRNIVPPDLLTRVLSAYNTAISHTWYVAIALSSTMLIPALCMEWKSIKGKSKGDGPGRVNKTWAEPNTMERPMSSAEKMQPTDASATSTSDSQSAKNEAI